MPPRKKKKPNWIALAYTGLQVIGLVIFSWINATHFDATELKMLAEYAAYWKILDSIKGRFE